MSDSQKFVAVTDKATGRPFFVLMTAKQEAELEPIATTPSPAPAASNPPAADLPQTC